MPGLRGGAKILNSYEVAVGLSSSRSANQTLLSKCMLCLEDNRPAPVIPLLSTADAFNRRPMMEVLLLESSDGKYHTIYGKKKT